MVRDGADGGLVSTTQIRHTRQNVPSEARDLQVRSRPGVASTAAPQVRAMRTYYVYILASRSRNLYVGVTSNLLRRLSEHRAGRSAHTRRYRITRLVYVETSSDSRAARARERQIKAYRREKRVALVVATNPAWNDLVPPTE